MIGRASLWWQALLQTWEVLSRRALQPTPGRLAVAPVVALVLLVASWWAVGHTGSLQVGTVEEAHGPARVERTRGGERQSLTPAPGLALFVGDVIRTGPGAEVLLRLLDGSVVSVGPQTVAQLDIVAGEPGPVHRLRLQVGGLVAQVMKVASRWRHLEVETPTAVAGVRGTTFVVHVAVDGKTSVYVQEGVVEVTNAQGSLVLAAGDLAESRPYQAPAHPAAPAVVPHRAGKDRAEDFQLAREVLRLLSGAGGLLGGPDTKPSSAGAGQEEGQGGGEKGSAQGEKEQSGGRGHRGQPGEGAGLEKKDGKGPGVDVSIQTGVELKVGLNGPKDGEPGGASLHLSLPPPAP